MKTIGVFVMLALFASLLATPVSAQQPAAAPNEHHPKAQLESSPMPAPAPMPGMKPGSMPMMDMCRQMMGDMTAMPMMGGPGPTDPKERAEMLQMRGGNDEGDG